MNRVNCSELPEAVKKLAEAQRAVLPSEVDACLNTCKLSKKQLEMFADAVTNKVVCDGDNVFKRRAICHARISNGMTLRKMSLISPYPASRFEAIELGTDDYIRPAEMRFFKELFGIAMEPDVPEVLNEDSGDGILISLRHMESFNNFISLADYAEHNCKREFSDGEMPGVNGIVIEAEAEDVGFVFPGKLLLLVSDIEREEEDVPALCKMDDGSFKLLQTGAENFYNRNGELFSKKYVSWYLPLRQIIFKVSIKGVW